jgi:uncharacterized protein YhbP (UPF0306 family)
MRCTREKVLYSYKCKLSTNSTTLELQVITDDHTHHIKTKDIPSSISGELMCKDFTHTYLLGRMYT